MRSKSRNPSWRSSSRISTLKPEGVRNSLSAARAKLWLARAVERPASKPLEFEADSLAAHLQLWPTAPTVKCRCLYRPDDSTELRLVQERNLLRLAAACRAQQRELLLEIVARGGGDVEVEESTTAQVLSRLYELGIRPDWWGLEPQPSARSWRRCADVITSNDEYCRGILVCGLDGSPEPIARSLTLAAAVPIVRGLIAGGGILAGGARAWLAGEKSDEAATLEIAARFDPSRAETHRRLFELHRRTGATDRAWLAATALEALGAANVDQGLLANQFRGNRVILGQLLKVSGMQQADRDRLSRAACFPAEPGPPASLSSVPSPCPARCSSRACCRSRSRSSPMGCCITVRCGRRPSRQVLRH